MIALGVRCSNSDVSYVFLTGTRETPNVVASGTRTFPKNFSRPQRLTWIVREIEALLKANEVGLVIIRQFEGRAKGTAYEDRVEAEAAVAIAAGNAGIRTVHKKRQGSLAKDLGLKGRARYLKTMDKSQLAGYVDMADKLQEAALCAWSALP